MPRLALAAAVVALAFIAFSVVDSGNGSSVEAATIEGVVLGNSDGALTVQTLDSLEEVTVPDNVAVSDASGGSINLQGINPGEVVLIQAQRRDGAIVARRVERLVENIDTWCSDNSNRCETLSQQLQQAADQCSNRPIACRAVLQQIDQLRLRAADVARLESLKTRCRTGGANACQELANLCRDNTDICANLAPVLPPSAPGAIRERLRDGLDACRTGDAAECRELANFCQNNPGTCPTTAGKRPNAGSNTKTPVPANAQ
jgi:hypothetical protein